MRIAFLAWETLHSIRVGGMSAHATEVATALARLGHGVHVFTRRGSVDQLLREEIDHVTYHRCDVRSGQSFLEEIESLNAAYIARVHQVAHDEGRFDVVHGHDWLAVRALCTLRRARSTRGVLTLHSTEYGRSGNRIIDGESAAIRSIEALGLRIADGVIAVSSALKEEILSQYDVDGDKIDVVYNGINLAQSYAKMETNDVRRELGIASDAPLILFVGRMVYQKGPDLLLEAAPSILSRFPSACIIYAGEGNLLSGVMSQARGMGLEHAVRFLGNVDRERLSTLYHASRLVCLPSRNEPFGLVVLEAWRAGKPVVATDVGGPGEIIWHGVTGSKIPPQPAAIAAAINDLLGDELRATWIGRNGRIAVEEAFSWDHAAQRVMAAYESL